ncbi:MAG TPA: hypothetical protein VD972_00140 [Hyalangium sp.]|nr:hypothetical protein [Hyalangium sp.]HYH94347.1 hypothetical protein [Hyalangium sp.]
MSSGPQWSWPPSAWARFAVASASSVSMYAIQCGGVPFFFASALSGIMPPMPRSPTFHSS